MMFKPFNPHQQLHDEEIRDPEYWRSRREKLATLQSGELRLENAKWFGEAMGFQRTAPNLWLINSEFTRRGIAPGWRGVPRFVKAAPLPAVSPQHKGPRSLGDVAQKSLMKRWIDLEWLRSELGPAHITKRQSWLPAFSADSHVAVSAFCKVNAIHSHGGGHYGTQPAHEVVHFLTIPKLHRLALTGLIDRDAGDLVKNAKKRVETLYRPRLEVLMQRATYPLNEDEVKRRLVFCEAIDLAVGRPTDAVRVFRWITGETVTRQTMHEMRGKIAEQCSLNGRAWVRKR